jgi:hypothetical protein
MILKDIQVVLEPKYLVLHSNQILKITITEQISIV